MAVMISNDKKELIVNCRCGCESTIHIRVNIEWEDCDIYALMAYLNGNWFRDQNDTMFGTLKRKFKKIWSIVRNKDYCYSEVLMSREDFDQFKEYINQYGGR